MNNSNCGLKLDGPTNFFRSCFIGDSRYCIGDFVLVKEGCQSADDARVARIEACCDRGSGYRANSRVVAYVTWFLRKGDVPGLKQADRELVMDKRDTQECPSILAADIDYTCRVVHASQLNKSDKVSFYFQSGYDGQKATLLPQGDLKPKFRYQLKTEISRLSSNDLENQSPGGRQQGNGCRRIGVSTPARSNPLVDLALSDNDTGSQSDDLDEIFSESLRHSMRNSSRKSKLQEKGRTYVDCDNLDVGDDEVTFSSNKPSRSARSSIQESRSSAKSTTRRRTLPVTAQSSKVLDDKGKGTGSKSTEKTTKQPAKKTAMKKNLIESVEYANERAPVDVSSTQHDPYNFASDDQASPRKTGTRHVPAEGSSHRTKKRATSTRELRKDAISGPEEPEPPIRRSRKATLDSKDSSDKPVDSKSSLSGFKEVTTRKRLTRSTPQPQSVDPAVKSATSTEMSSSARRQESSVSSSSKTEQAVRRRQRFLLDTSVFASDSESSESDTTSVSKSQPRLARRSSTRTRNETSTKGGKPTLSLDDSIESAAEVDPDPEPSRPKRKSSARAGSKRNATKDTAHLMDTSALESGTTPNVLPTSKRKSSRSTAKDTGHLTDSSTIESGTAPSSRRKSSRTTAKKVNYSVDALEDPDSDVDSGRLSSRKSRQAKVTKDVASSRAGRNLRSAADVDYEIASRSSDSSESSGSEYSEPAAKRLPLRRQDIRSQLSKTTPSRTPGPARRRVARCTPSVPSRKTPIQESGTALEKARAQLHVSVVPDSLPCREEEFANILSYVESKLENGTGGCLYISGVPGTGKTATVYEVMRSLQQAQSEGTVEDFKFVEVNGMRLTQPHQTFVHIYKHLTGRQVTAEHATSLLDSMFSKSKKQDRIVLLVDELDLLMTRKQDVLYNLFDWPTKPKSRLIVLAIANTMDLPERVMMNRVSSRLGLNRMTFQPYTFQQLQEIVHSRLSGIPAFDPDAVQLASRKVAAVSGDARRALDICRRATEVAEATGNDLVTMLHVDKALQEMFFSPKVTAIRNCSLYEKIVLRAIMAEFTRSGLEEATLYQVFRHIVALCVMDMVPTLKMTHMNRICSNLNNIKLVLLEYNGNGIHQRIRLNVGQDDVQYALRDESS